MKTRNRILLISVAAGMLLLMASSLSAKESDARFYPVLPSRRGTP